MVPERNHEERLIHVFPCGFLTIMNNSLLSTTQKVSKLSSRLPDIPFCEFKNNSFVPYLIKGFRNI